MSLSAVELRRALHANPEPSFKEFATTALIEENISKIYSGLEYVRILKPLQTGLLIEYRAAGPEEPFVLVRADIDALKMDEATGCEYKSVNGFMHSCGHDVHCAVLYGFIRRAAERKIKKNFLFLFQPAEESGGGAELVIKSGILDKYNISSAYALHVNDEFEEGSLASTDGVLFASAREADIEFIGKASHIAFPERGIDALKAARLFLDAAGAEALKYGGRLIFGVGMLNAGEVRNILPARAVIKGSIRALSTSVSDEFYEKLSAVLRGVKDSLKVDFNLKTGSYYPEVSVDSELFSRARALLDRKFNFINCGHKLTGEDFGFISKRYPSFMFWLGTGAPGVKPAGLHNPEFFPPESVIEKGIEILTLLLSGA
ncbi:MAG TPA: amidohydrolase [Candidatus Wallbacteria bacterium]|nr:MAG: N-acetyldiaminopimelate deacetylase [bacterium ADurb.Bin243]HOD41878.1 amidohydrolase [Candidatus Wallbacteria bacterium]HPG58686.1 amidohydrolase [Candidatus Wallbacteria bacterium]